MKPEEIDTYRFLQDDVRTARQALSAFQEYRHNAGPPVEVENLSPIDRFERLSGLIEQMVKDPSEARSMFGAQTSYIGNTLPRRVDTNHGTYCVSFTLEKFRTGFRQPEVTDITARWTSYSSSFTFEHVEGTSDPWIEKDPTNLEGLRSLTDLEWSLDAYLNGFRIVDQ